MNLFFNKRVHKVQKSSGKSVASFLILDFHLGIGEVLIFRYSKAQIFQKRRPSYKMEVFIRSFNINIFITVILNLAELENVCGK